jgi:hypothetical protein
MNSYGRLALDEGIFDFVSNHLPTSIDRMKSMGNLETFVENVVLMVKKNQVRDRMSSAATNPVDSGHNWESV